MTPLRTSRVSVKRFRAEQGVKPLVGLYVRRWVPPETLQANPYHYVFDMVIGVGRLWVTLREVPPLIDSLPRLLRTKTGPKPVQNRTKTGLKRPAK